tara:strand:+ start:34 stop:324 length:291 start_codon:yes stop_codon:yes gene_type:complete
MFGGFSQMMPGMFGGGFQSQGPQRLQAQQAQAAGGMFGGRSPRMPSARQLQQMVGGIMFGGRGRAQSRGRGQLEMQYGFDGKPRGMGLPTNMQTFM